MLAKKSTHYCQSQESTTKSVCKNLEGACSSDVFLSRGRNVSRGISRVEIATNLKLTPVPILKFLANSTY